MDTMDVNKKSPVFRYLPTTLLSNWAMSPKQNPVWGEWLHGTLMHCDVTGFTAMNEALASMGNEGAEIMVKILNQFFERMLRIGEDWNGIQMKFGGDAMLLYFPNEHHALCAAKCGLEMQAAMKDFSQVKINDSTCQLRMRIGIHSGRFYSASLGDEQGLLHYLLTGYDVNRTADVEPLAEPGQVVVSDETAQLLKGCSRLLKTEHEGIWEVRHADILTIEKLDQYVPDAPQNTLKRYLMTAVANGKTTGSNGEHRRATISFIYLFGLSELLENSGEEEAIRQANEYIQMVLSIAEKYGGSLLASDVAEHADKIVVTFGAPLSIADQEGSCLRFAFELKEAVAESNLDLRHQIGINTGFIFAGEVGSSWRREYTTIGDNMNLAARLMTAAGEGNILVSSNTADKVGDEFRFEILEPILVKGKSKPINISRLISISSSSQRPENSENSVFIGRDEELGQLQDTARKVELGVSSSVFISGEAGIGKTALCGVLTSQLQAEGWLTTNSICQSYDERNAFSAWRYPLQKICALSERDSRDVAWDKIKNLISQHCPWLNDFAPLIAEILLIQHEASPLVASLDAKTKREKRILIIKTLVTTISTQAPICLIFDNVNWIDNSSAEIIQELMSIEDANLYFVFSTRNEYLPESLSGCNINAHQKLTTLSDEHSLELVASLASVDNAIANKIAEKSRGNPLFINELSLCGNLKDGALPDSIYDVIMVKLDRLQFNEKLFLTSAAVVGQVFDIEVIEGVNLAQEKLLYEA